MTRNFETVQPEEGSSSSMVKYETAMTQRSVNTANFKITDLLEQSFKQSNPIDFEHSSNQSHLILPSHRTQVNRRILQAHSEGRRSENCGSHQGKRDHDKKLPSPHCDKPRC